MRKKILFVVTLNEWGGAQKYVFDLATHLPKDQFDILVAVGIEGNGELIKKLSQNSIKSSAVKNLRRDIKPISDLKAFFELLQLFKNASPDVVHLNSTKAGVLGSIAAKLAGVPKIIYTVHGWVFHEPLSPFTKIFYYLAEKVTAFFKSKIICVSEFDRKIAIEKKVAKAEKLVTIHNGIDRATIKHYEKDEARKRLSVITGKELKHDKIVIGTVANFYKTKGLPYLIDAAHTLPQYTFLIIGEGPERQSLEKRIREKKAANVILAGFIPEASQYLKAFDCFVLPSVKEGYPYTILEALFAEIPIIGTNVGGMPEMLPHECLIPPADSGALIHKLSIFGSLPKKITLPSTLQETVEKTRNVYYV